MDIEKHRNAAPRDFSTSGYLRQKFGLYPTEDQQCELDRLDAPTSPEVKAQRAETAYNIYHGAEIFAFHKMVRLGWSADFLGSGLHAYLKSRGLDPDFADTLCPRVLKCVMDGGPAQMVARFSHVLTDDFCAIHRTFIFEGREGERVCNMVTETGVGGVSPIRKSLGPIANAAIKLAPHEAIVATGELIVGEGIETCLAARQLGYGLGWAMGCSGNIARLKVLPFVHTLTILAENDDGASKAAWTQCARRWKVHGKKVFILFPETGCKDFNDVLAVQQWRASHDQI